ncbi:MAG TPA: hydroxymethylbilane synthase [Ilumatobacteraceae bacterium]|nr:hydroxymethylbilane synthase [Ilumatobacteraceae bacterium]
MTGRLQHEHDPAALRLATRGSRQAVAQSTAVADRITAATGRMVELVMIETTGDARLDVPLHVIGGQGVFVKEVQHAVLDGRADLAVHSAKDLPSAPTDGLVIGAFCERRDPADALVGRRLDDLAQGATVATGSVRRRAQLSRVRPDLQFIELRGNIDTRLSKVPDNGAIVMAVAALEILGLTDRIAERLDVATFVPAVGQGCVAVECRIDDAGTLAALAGVDHLDTRRGVEVERAFLAELGSGCSLPVGGHVSNGRLLVFLADSATRQSIVAEVALTGTADDLGIARRAALGTKAALR